MRSTTVQHVARRMIQSGQKPRGPSIMPCHQAMMVQPKQPPSTTRIFLSTSSTSAYFQQYDFDDDWEIDRNDTIIRAIEEVCG